jgi:DNA-binding IclR family transcriptional regulator
MKYEQTQTNMKTSDSALKPLEILEVLSEADNDGMGATTLSEKTGLSKSTVHRLANALAGAGYVIRNDTTKKYKLGYRILRISSSFINKIEIKEVARSYLEELSEKTQETAHLVQLDGLHGVYIDKIDSPQPVGLLSQIGKRILLHCTGAGKILFAYMPEEIRDQVYTEVGLPKQTEHTLVTREAMEMELAEIRRLGYGLDRIEAREGICCIAAPIYNQNGQVIASFSISGPSYRFSPADAEALAEMVKETSDKISKDLGYIG